jgi:hypothetical protein
LQHLEGRVPQQKTKATNTGNAVCTIGQNNPETVPVTSGLAAERWPGCLNSLTQTSPTHKILISLSRFR